MLAMPLAMLGHLIAAHAKASGKTVSRKVSPDNAKEILAWGAKNYAQ